MDIDFSNVLMKDSYAEGEINDDMEFSSSSEKSLSYSSRKKSKKDILCQENIFNNTLSM